MIEKGVSHIAYFRTDGGSSKLYTQEYVDEKDKEIEKLNKGYCPIKEKCNKGECDCTNEEYNQMCEENIKLDLEIERLKESEEYHRKGYAELYRRIDEAIEYIEENCTEHGEGKWAYRTINADNVLDILKEGDDKE